MGTTVEDLGALADLVGRQLGYSEWQSVTQEQVNLFAEATGDHQWIHVDVERATAESPFGGPVAHGYLTLSLLPVLLPQVLTVRNVGLVINYGTNKVRFPSPVPVGADLRLGATLAAVEELEGGVQVALDVVVEVRDAPKPSCVAQVLYRYYR